METNRRWGYSIKSWWGHPHYHVTLFPDYRLREVFKFGSDVNQPQRFNTTEEANKFIAGFGDG